MQSRKNNRKSNRNNRNNRSKKVRQPTFAAKLGAFILQAVSPKDKIVWSKEVGFTAKHPQVFGVLPFLHLNVSEKQFRALLTGSHNNHVNALTGLCNGMNLNNVLHKVNFSCKNQSDKGILSLEDAIVDSINNRWNIRRNGRKHLAQIEKYMRKQVELNIIPSRSVSWAN